MEEVEEINQNFTSYIGRLFDTLVKMNTPFSYTYTNIPVYEPFPMAYKNDNVEILSLLDYAIDNYKVDIMDFRSLVLKLNLVNPVEVEPNIVYLYMYGLKNQHQNDDVLPKISDIGDIYVNQLLNYIAIYPIPGAPTIENLEDIFEVWNDNLVGLVEEQERINQIIQQDELSLRDIYTKYPMDIEERRSIFRARVRYRDNLMNQDIGFQFYINEHVNEQIIMIRYGDNFRVYEKRGANVNYYEQLRKIRADSNTIRIVFAPQDGKEINQNNISLVTINLVTSDIYININVKQSSTDTVIQELEKINLTLEDLNIDRIAVQARIYAGPIQEHSFLHYLLIGTYREKTYFNEFMYVEEATNAVAVKRRINIYYRFPKREIYRSVFTDYPDNLVANVEIVPAIRSDGGIQRGDFILELNINKADSIESVEAFLNTMSSFINSYLKDKSNIDTLYRQFEILKVIKERKEVTSNKALRDIGFPTHYSRKCSPTERLPEIINPDDLSEFLNTPIINKEGNFQRAVIPITHNGVLYNIGCKNQNHPFIGFVKGNTDSPCCFKSARSQNEALSILSGQVESEITQEPAKTSNYTGTRAEKILGDNKNGNLPADLHDYLISIFPGSASTNRRGTADDNNSLIHAIIRSFTGNFKNIDDDKIDFYKNIAASYMDDRNSYIESLRQELSDKYHPELVKQELWDYDNNQIIDNIIDINKPFNDSLYRLLEEYFSINIFFFETRGNKSYIMNPRNKYYHVSVYRERPCVLIYAVAPGHYETIFVGQRAIFDEGISNEIYLASKNTQLTINAYLDNPNIAYPEDVIPEIESLGLKIVSQYIDGAGKTRALITENGISFILLEPTQPINVPTFSDKNLPIIDKIPDSFGDPISYADGIYKGYYYEKWFIVANIRDNEKLELTYSPELVIDPKYAQSAVESRINLEIQRDIILQLIVWLFNLYLLQKNDVIEAADDFLNNEFLIGDDNKYKYKFIDIWKEHTLPITNYNDALKYLEKTNFILNDKIFIYSETMYHGITYFMKKYISYNQPSIPNKLVMVYDKADMYPRIMDELVFLSLVAFDRWINENAMKHNIIYDNVQWDLINPYLIYHNEEIIIVQNVVAGNKNAAINVVNNYLTTSINTGYETSKTPLITKRPIQTIILTDSGTIPMEQNLAYDNIYIIRDHNTERYAAILGTLNN